MSHTSTHPSPEAPVRDGRHDFDFVHGSWIVANRRLLRRLQGCQEWETFPGLVENQPLLGGLGNLEQFSATLPGDVPFEGLALRLYDPEAHVWRIHWADDRRGKLDPALEGTFEGPRGTFIGEDTFEGRPILVRFLWISVSADESRWEQAFSEDGGRSWETNWINTFHRVKP